MRKPEGTGHDLFLQLIFQFWGWEVGRSFKTGFLCVALAVPGACSRTHRDRYAQTGAGISEGAVNRFQFPDSDPLIGETTEEINRGYLHDVRSRFLAHRIWEYCGVVLSC